MLPACFCPSPFLLAPSSCPYLSLFPISFFHSFPSSFVPFSYLTSSFWCSLSLPLICTPRFTHMPITNQLVFGDWTSPFLNKFRTRSERAGRSRFGKSKMTPGKEQERAKEILFNFFSFIYITLNLFIRMPLPALFHVLFKTQVNGIKNKYQPYHAQDEVNSYI